MISTDLDIRLEPELKELYKLHKDRAKNIDWGYHDFLPWDKGQDFRRVPWDESQVTLPSGVITAVETALLTEVNLPWFTSYLHSTFKGSLSVITDFIHTWTAEEDQHSNLIETYLLLTRNVNPARLHELRRTVVEGGYEPDFHTAIEAMTYTTLQELATMVFYNNVAKIAGPHDKDLSTLLRRLAKDETLHYAFYRDVVKLHLDLEPNYCCHIANVIINFEMPGCVMPNFDERMSIIAKEANYGPLQYFDQVLDVVIDYWGLKDLRPTAPEAEEARMKVLNYHQRLKKIRDRAMRKMESNK
jgi:acyl-[acyl-carrier-protein] desaturase